MVYLKDALLSFIPSFTCSFAQMKRSDSCLQASCPAAAYGVEGDSFSPTGWFGWHISLPNTETLDVVWTLSQVQWGIPWSEHSVCNWPFTPCKLLFSAEVMLGADPDWINDPDYGNHLFVSALPESSAPSSITWVMPLQLPIPPCQPSLPGACETPLHSVSPATHPQPSLRRPIPLYLEV